MARKRTATALKLVTGNPGHRPLPENEPQPVGDPIKPAFLKGRAAEIWDEYCPRLFWLTSVDSHTLAAWCVLAEEIEVNHARMDTARITQFRLLAGDLGMAPTARAKLGTSGNDSKKNDPAQKYLAGNRKHP